MSEAIENILQAHLLEAPPVETDFPFWYRLAYSAEEPVLVLGPAAGRVALPLARYGIQTVALSTDGLEIEDPDLPLTVVQGEPTSATLRGPFGLILAPMNTLSLAGGGSARATLGVLRGVLRLGGRLALALSLPMLDRLAEAAAPGGSPLRVVSVSEGPEPGQQWHLSEAWQYAPTTQLLARHLHFELVDEAEGTSLGRWHRRVQQRLFWPTEVEALLEASGCRVESVHGGFRGEALSGESRWQVWVGRKIQ